MTSSLARDQRLPGVVPVFPLPNVVLFPGTIVPLHVFEPRYRQMIVDSAAADRVIGIALLEPGYDADYQGHPPFHPIGTVGRIDQLDRLPDGRFNMNVVGLHRVAYDEIPSSKPYRLTRLTRLPEKEVDDLCPEIVRAKRDLLVSQAMLLRELKGDDDPTLIIDERLPFALAVNGACANLPVASEVRQELLAIDCLVERHRRASRLIAGVLQSLLSMRGGELADDARPS
ncbi:MAG TPA: LON peptidase substrate-binding domain-containing protein [Candidatus Polarisedimenticolaceae bacterium]|nr:LON peptidase substrate-binding domain-containing protein [Candidatus Polarisedimenticolaceae bacterium]